MMPLTQRSEVPSFSCVLVLSGLLNALLAVSAVHAQTPSPAVEPPAAESPKTAATKKTEAPKITAAPGKGLTLTTADNRFSTTLRTRMQIREKLSFKDGDSTLTFQVKTLRLINQGHVLDPNIGYNIQLAFGAGDYESDSASPLFDAWVEWLHLADLNLRVGQFFVPFDRARTLREFALHMVDRQQVVRELTLDRDVGIMISSQSLWGTMLGYHFFVGSGDGRNRLNAPSAGPIVVTRLVLRPLGLFDDDQEGDLTRERKPRLAIGIAGAYNYQTERQMSTYGTTYTAGTTNYVHGAADLLFKYAGFSLLTEGLIRKANQDSITADVDGVAVTQWTRSGYGYLVQMGFMVSDQIETTTRWERLKAFSGTDPSFASSIPTSGNQVGVGLNYYLNGHAFKVQTDYFHIFGNDFGTGEHLARLQLDASF